MTPISHFEDVHTVIAERSRRGAHPLVLGICGSQGSGKSTLAQTLKTSLREQRGLATAVLSLDDLYRSSSERARLAREVHPLLRTRGVPGTHNVDLGIDVIQRLVAAGPSATTHLPRFDKAHDEPVPEDKWESFAGRADCIIFEGWCVGAVPEATAALVEPINELERTADPDGVWRRYVNEQLGGHYQRLFGLLDYLILLQAPSFDVVFAWRQQQERELAARVAAADTSSTTKIMDDETLQRFIMHYERLTRHVLAEMPARADLTLVLDPGRQVVDIRQGVRPLK